MALARQVLEQGTPVPSVQGVNCLRLVKSPETEFYFADGHPLCTTRSLKYSMRSIKVELRWILSGSCWIQDLHKFGVHFWDKWNHPYTRSKPEWERPEGYFGPIYGHQFCNFGATRKSDGTYENDGFDQLSEVVRLLKERQYDRRLRTVTYNPNDAQYTFLVPCWGEFHFFVENGKLWVKNKQRSCDLLVGGAFDLVTHSILFEMIGQCAGLEVEGFVWKHDDLHIYLNQVAKLLDLLYPTGKYDVFGEEIMEIDERVKVWAEKPGRAIEELYGLESRLPEEERQGNRLKDWFEREPLPLPRIELHPQVKNLSDFQLEDIIVKGYNPHPDIKGIPVLT